MRNGHTLNAPIECLDELVDRTAALACILGNSGNAREHVLDAVVKLRDQQALVFVSPLALCNVNGQALDAYTLPGRVELGHCCFLEPYFPPVGLGHTKRYPVSWLVGSDTSQLRFVSGKIRRVDQLTELCYGKRCLRVVPKSFCRALAVMA